MYGNLEEIDVNSLLNLLSEQQRSGIFFIENEQSLIAKKNIYFIFFSQGKVVFAGDKYSFNFQRIKEYLTSYKFRKKLNKVEKKINKSLSIAEYEIILLLGYKQLISLEEQKEICYRIIDEILFKIINLKTGHFIWQDTFNLQPLIINFRIEQLLPSVMRKKLVWETLSPYVQDIEECPEITDMEKKDFLRENLGQILCDRLDGKTSFIQLSRYFNDSLSNIGKRLYPYIKQGIIKIITPVKSEKLINFKLTINSQILYFNPTSEWNLKINKFSFSNQYRFLISNNISQFFANMLNLPIKLIILHSEVDNNYDTYNLCKMIRNNYQTSKLPIIRVVNKYTFQDNLISKIYGVTEYIGEDIFNEKMLQIIDRYL